MNKTRSVTIRSATTLARCQFPAAAFVRTIAIAATAAGFVASAAHAQIRFPKDWAPPPPPSRSLYFPAPGPKPYHRVRHADLPPDDVFIYVPIPAAADDPFGNPATGYRFPYVRTLPGELYRGIWGREFNTTESQRRAFAGALPGGVCPGSVAGQQARERARDINVMFARIRECLGFNGSGSPH